MSEQHWEDRWLEPVDMSEQHREDSQGWQREWDDAQFHYPTARRFKTGPTNRAAKPVTITQVENTAPVRSIRPNKYGGSCVNCGQYVLANGGSIERVGDKWAVSHILCPEPAPVVENAGHAAIVAAIVPSTPKLRTNKYAGRCANCKRNVPAETGTLERSEGKWLVYHLEGSCPTNELDGVPEGGYALVATSEDGTETVKFYTIHDGRLSAKASNDEWPIKGDAAIAAILTLIKFEGIEICARRYGVELGQCCRCGRDLTSDWRKQGIGPICSEKAGW